MPSIDEISAQQLSRIIGLPGAPRLIDVRSDVARRREACLLPTARILDAGSVSAWAADFRGAHVVVHCDDGGALSQGAAAWLRSDGIHAEVLAGGFDGWTASRQLFLRPDNVPPRDEYGRTVWVTPARPKIVRIACPWLIQRFIDPDARFLYVAASEIAAITAKFQATPFDTGLGLWKPRRQVHVRCHAR